MQIKFPLISNIKYVKCKKNTSVSNSSSSSTLKEDVFTSTSRTLLKKAPITTTTKTTFLDSNDDKRKIETTVDLSGYKTKKEETQDLVWKNNGTAKTVTTKNANGDEITTQTSVVETDDGYEVFQNSIISYSNGIKLFFQTTISYDGNIKTTEKLQKNSRGQILAINTKIEKN